VFNNIPDAAQSRFGIFFFQNYAKIFIIQKMFAHQKYLSMEEAGVALND